MDINKYIEEKHPNCTTKQKGSIIWVYCGTDKPIIYDINLLNYLLETNQENKTQTFKEKQ